MSACGMQGCTGRMRRMWPPTHPVDATPFRCSNCGRTTHSAACVDDEGRIECVCGFDDIEARQAAWPTP